MSYIHRNMRHPIIIFLNYSFKFINCLGLYTIFLFEPCREYRNN